MKCAVSDETDVRKIPKDTSEIHLVRPIKKENLDFLLINRPIRKISLSSSCIKRLPKKAQQKIRERGIELTIEKRRGRAIDIPLEMLMEIIELRKDYQSIRDIEKITDVPKSTIHYLLKYADRGKIKKGDNVMYLK
jgi:hypothetical protein